MNVNTINNEILQGITHSIRCTSQQISNHNIRYFYRSLVLGEAIELVEPNSGNEIVIIIKSPTNKLITVKVGENGTIGYLHQQLCKSMLIHPTIVKLTLGGRKLIDNETFTSLFIKNNAELDFSIEYKTTYQESFIYQLITVAPSVIDPTYDKDFTNMAQVPIQTRGGLPYTKPYGWKRYGLRVKGMFENDDWIRNDGGSGEWAVAYHGTKEQYVDSITKGGLKIGPNNAYGIGVYCTPSVGTAQSYSRCYKCVVTGKSYFVILQTRVNPTTLVQTKNLPNPGPNDYWYQPNEKDIRPYGILFLEV